MIDLCGLGALRGRGALIRQVSDQIGVFLRSDDENAAI